MSNSDKNNQVDKKPVNKKSVVKPAPVRERKSIWKKD